MRDRIGTLIGIASNPLAIAKRHLHLKLHKKERLSKEAFNEWLKERILSGIPTAVIRFGETEMRSLSKYAFNKAQKTELSYRNEVERLCKHAGFFPCKEELIERYCETNIELLDETDALGVWDLPMERYYAKKYMKNPVQTELENLEPYYSDEPWSSALSEKKVLVVHPFSGSIMAQYMNNRERLFENKAILPQFELKCYKAVQSMGGVPDGKYKDWFEALDHMEKEISEIDFDVALIGCGAYGLPLALRIKRMGKIAIQLGGATQMLFGVYGKRWEHSEFINEYWIRPSNDEKSVNYNQVEQGCYW